MQEDQAQCQHRQRESAPSSHGLGPASHQTACTHGSLSDEFAPHRAPESLPAFSTKPPKAPRLQPQTFISNLTPSPEVFQLPLSPLLRNNSTDNEASDFDFSLQARPHALSAGPTLRVTNPSII